MMVVIERKVMRIEVIIGYVLILFYAFLEFETHARNALWLV